MFLMGGRKHKGDEDELERVQREVTFWKSELEAAVREKRSWTERFLRVYQENEQLKKELSRTRQDYEQMKNLMENTLMEQSTAMSGGTSDASPHYQRTYNLAQGPPPPEVVYSQLQEAERRIVFLEDRLHSMQQERTLMMRKEELLRTSEANFQRENRVLREEIKNQRGINELTVDEITKMLLELSKVQQQNSQFHSELKHRDSIIQLLQSQLQEMTASLADGGDTERAQLLQTSLMEPLPKSLQTLCLDPTAPDHEDLARQDQAGSQGLAGEGGVLPSAEVEAIRAALSSGPQALAMITDDFAEDSVPAASPLLSTVKEPNMPESGHLVNVDDSSSVPVQPAAAGGNELAVKAILAGDKVPQGHVDAVRSFHLDCVDLSSSDSEGEGGLAGEAEDTPAADNVGLNKARELKGDGDKPSGKLPEGQEAAIITRDTGIEKGSTDRPTLDVTSKTGEDESPVEFGLDIPEVQANKGPVLDGESGMVGDLVVGPPASATLQSGPEGHVEAPCNEKEMLSSQIHHEKPGSQDFCPIRAEGGKVAQDTLAVNMVLQEEDAALPVVPGVDHAEADDRKVPELLDMHCPLNGHVSDVRATGGEVVQSRDQEQGEGEALATESSDKASEGVQTTLQETPSGVLKLDIAVSKGEDCKSIPNDQEAGGLVNGVPDQARTEHKVIPDLVSPVSPGTPAISSADSQPVALPSPQSDAPTIPLAANDFIQPASTTPDVPSLAAPAETITAGRTMSRNSSIAARIAALKTTTQPPIASSPSVSRPPSFNRGPRSGDRPSDVGTTLGVAEMGSTQSKPPGDSASLPVPGGTTELPFKKVMLRKVSSELVPGEDRSNPVEVGAPEDSTGASLTTGTPVQDKDKNEKTLQASVNAVGGDAAAMSNVTPGSGDVGGSMPSAGLATKGPEAFSAPSGEGTQEGSPQLTDKDAVGGLKPATSDRSQDDLLPAKLAARGEGISHEPGAGTDKGPKSQTGLDTESGGASKGDIVKAQLQKIKGEDAPKGPQQDNTVGPTEQLADMTAPAPPLPSTPAPLAGMVAVKPASGGSAPATMSSVHAPSRFLKSVRTSTGSTAVPNTIASSASSTTPKFPYAPFRRTLSSSSGGGQSPSGGPVGPVEEVKNAESGEGGQGSPGASTPTATKFPFQTLRRSSSTAGSSGESPLAAAGSSTASTPVGNTSSTAKFPFQPLRRTSTPSGGAGASESSQGSTGEKAVSVEENTTKRLQGVGSTGQKDEPLQATGMTSNGIADASSAAPGPAVSTLMRSMSKVQAMRAAFEQQK